MRQRMDQTGKAISHERSNPRIPCLARRRTASMKWVFTVDRNDEPDMTTPQTLLLERPLDGSPHTMLSA